MKKALIFLTLFFLFQICRAKSIHELYITSPTPVNYNSALNVYEIFLNTGDSVTFQAVTEVADPLFGSTYYPDVIWEKDSIAISTTASNKISVKTSGTYGYECTANCNFSRVVLHFPAPTGVANITGDSGLPRVYPTLCHDNTRIYFESIPSSSMKVNVFNQLGSMINLKSESILNEGKDLLFNTEDLAPGLYFLVISWDDKNSIQKIIKY